jgi:uncharacterized protein YdhG (YjbR/CyaY superfamily)
MNTKPESVAAYIATFPVEVQAIMQEIRATIIAAAPEAEESISYGMPAYKLNGKALVYFAAYKNHIGFYATPTGHEQFSKELSIYKQGKGSVQFPINDHMPLQLISDIVVFRMSQSTKKKSKS